MSHSTLDKHRSINDDAATFLEQADLRKEAKAAIAHGNTERLLRLA